MNDKGSGLDAARKALARHAWSEALELLKRADEAGELDAEGLEMLADAAWWNGRPEDSVAAHERAYAAAVAGSDKHRAVRAALRLAQANADRQNFTVAQGWFGRAQKLVEHDEDSVELAYVLFFHALMGPPSPLDEALARGRRITIIGERFGDRDLQAMGVMAQGAALFAEGRIKESFAKFDEATMAAATGDLEPWTAGWVYCSTIGSCRELVDYRRASEWTDATTRWCEREQITGFPGICRVYRAEIVALRGEWAQAEQEARQACEELQRFQIQQIAALGFYEIGALRLRMGDLPAAADAFRRTHEMGMLPEPGLSLLRLAEGDAEAAGASLRRALADEQLRSARARILPVEVDVALALGDRERARRASAELDEIAKTFGTAAMDAMAGTARAALHLAEGDTASAEPALRKALRSWVELDAPYEIAQTRVLLAAVYRVQGDAPSATQELQAARSAFERLGARLDTKRVAALLGDAVSRPAQAIDDHVERTFLFTDIVRSTKLVDAIGDEAWQDLIRWHDQTLRSLIAEHRGEEIRHQGDGFFVAFAVAADALECAVAIQRRLSEQRRQHGFALQVRIGMHTAPAHRRGLDYAGIGIHEAARIGGVADAGEILVSAATLSAAGARYAVTKRTVSLKDIAVPVEIGAIDWR